MATSVFAPRKKGTRSHFRALSVSGSNCILFHFRPTAFFDNNGVGGHFVCTWHPATPKSMQCNTLPQSALLLALSIILFARIIWPGQRQTSFATKLQSLITKLTWPWHFLCICLAVLMPHIHTSLSRQSYQLFCHCNPFLCSGLYCPIRLNKKVCLLPGQTSWCEHLLCQLNTRFGSLSCLIEDYRKGNDSIDTDLLNWFDLPH